MRNKFSQNRLNPLCNVYLAVCRLRDPCWIGFSVSSWIRKRKSHLLTLWLYMYLNSRMSKKLVIKRYGNRRLYNTETSSHVTLNQLVELIRQGRDCVVIDSKTKEDITKTILVQIILEEERSGKNLLPVEFLYQLIRNQDESFHDFFQNYMSVSFESYLKARSEFERRFRSWLELGSTAPQIWDKIFSVDAAREFWGIKKGEEK